MSKVLIVTGGSRGIGAATAQLAAQRGYAVCVNYLRQQEAANRVVDSIQQQGGRAIVNVSSGAARLGSPGEYIDYAASKGAIDTMTIGLAKEVAPEGIRVNAVRPAFIYTDIHANGGEPDRVDRVKAFTPMKRGGEAIEVAQAILWLLSEEASYTTGSFIDVTGGM
jgi:NAD(P)-dependent dehydrogenase (short-subunit alcohol dehydrogenase family)